MIRFYLRLRGILYEVDAFTKLLRNGRISVGSAAPVLDTSRLTAFSGGDQALAAEFMGLFLKNARAYIQDIERKADKPALLLHKLRGAAMTVGAMRLAGVCSGDEVDDCELVALVTGLRHELAAVEREASIFST